MASVTFAINESLKVDLEHFSWVNWSEIVKGELLKDLQRSEALEQFLKIISKSKLTEKDAELLSDSVKKSMLKRLKSEGLI